MILMMMVTILLISLTAALPSIYTEGQREKEEELIFRGNEYARAILFFHNKFGRYPSSVDELLKKTNGFRFLRHAYKDPMTPQGDWRFIHANAAGMVIDSKTMTLPTGATNPNGQNQPGQQGAGVSQSGASNNVGLNPIGQQSVDLSQPATANNDAVNSPDQQNTETGQTPQDSGSQAGEPQTGSSTSTNKQMLGAFIVGVASTSHKSSIRIYNNETEYDKWEFLAVGQGVGGLLAPGGTLGGATLPGQPDSGQNPGQNPGTGPGTVGGQAGPGAPQAPVQPEIP